MYSAFRTAKPRPLDQRLCLWTQLGLRLCTLQGNIILHSNILFSAITSSFTGTYILLKPVHFVTTGVRFQLDTLTLDNGMSAAVGLKTADHRRPPQDRIGSCEATSQSLYEQ